MLYVIAGHAYFSYGFPVAGALLGGDGFLCAVLCVLPLCVFEVVNLAAVSNNGKRI